MLHKQIEALGTSILIKTDSSSPKTEHAIEDACNEVQRIEQEYSRFLSDNQLSKLNSNIGKWQTVSPELFKLLSFGKALEEKSGGSFSLSVKSVLESWGYNETYELDKESSPGKIGVFELRNNTQEIKISASLEIGAIGKGHALDCMKKKLDTFENIFINAGGDIYARGKNQGEPWTCFLEHPKDATKVIGEINLDNKFLAASSPLKRQWRNRHHLINGRTQEPANEMLATYVLANTGLKADAYSTLLFSLGYKEAKNFIAVHQLAAMIIGPQGDIFVSPGFQGKLYGK